MLLILKNHIVQSAEVNMCSPQIGSENQSENFLQRLFSKKDKEKEKEK